MYNQENNQKITNPIYFPMITPSVFGRADSADVRKKRWDIFNALPEQEKDKILAPNVAFTLKNVAEKYDLSDEEAMKISRLVRELFFRNISKENIAVELQRRISRLTNSELKDVEKIIIYQILTANTSQIKEASFKTTNIIKLSLENALSRYPNLGEQSITANQLRLRITPNPVKPSIKNWISDYCEQMGSGKHEAFDRGNYLFHSENTKILTAIERKKLSLVLKSLDEGMLLNVDPEKQEVVFELEGSSNIQMETSVLRQSINHLASRGGQMNRNDENIARREVGSGQKQDTRKTGPGTGGIGQEGGFMDGMRTLKEKKEVKETKEMETSAQTIFRQSNLRNFSNQNTRVTQQSVDMTGVNAMSPNQETKINQFFGENSVSDFVGKGKTEKFSPKPQVSVHSTAVPSNFADVIQKKPSNQTQEKIIENAAGAATPARIVPKSMLSQNANGGSVSFSSPQQLPIEKKQMPSKKSPFRIVPHGDL